LITREWAIEIGGVLARPAAKNKSLSGPLSIKNAGRTVLSFKKLTHLFNHE
jgi:hypothetical protein